MSTAKFILSFARYIILLFRNMPIMTQMTIFRELHDTVITVIIVIIVIIVIKRFNINIE